MRSRGSIQLLVLKAPAQPVPGGALVALHERVPLQGRQQPEGGRPVHVQPARHIRAGAPASLGEQVEDRDGPLDRPHRDVSGLLVAHCATLSLLRGAPGRKLLSSEHQLGDAQHMSRT